MLVKQALECLLQRNSMNEDNKKNLTENIEISMQTLYKKDGGWFKFTWTHMISKESFFKDFKNVPEHMIRSLKDRKII